MGEVVEVDIQDGDGGVVAPEEPRAEDDFRFSGQPPYSAGWGVSV